MASPTTASYTLKMPYDGHGQRITQVTFRRLRVEDYIETETFSNEGARNRELFLAATGMAPNDLGKMDYNLDYLQAMDVLRNFISSSETDRAKSTADTCQLLYPYSSNSKQYSKVQFKRLTVNDYIQTEGIENENTRNRLLFMASSGMTDTDLQAMDYADYTEAMEVLVNFTNTSPAAGTVTSSAT